MSEYDLIRNFAGAFKRSPMQENGLFECDSELVRIGGQLWALTMDEFSPEEDLFTSDDPEVLGWNLAVATISDILAAGARPEWFMHSVSLPKTVDQPFVSGLAKGISAALDEAGCSLCGGDFGCSENWRFCGFAMGPVQENRRLTRIIPCRPQALWVTGRVGDANLAALTGSPTPRFELRLGEAEAIRSIATACMDTSGGFLDTVWQLHSLNPNMRLEIDLDSVPFAAGVGEAAGAYGFPVEAALLGGAGEYELLFAATDGERVDGATRVGVVSPEPNGGVHLYRGSDLISEMNEPPPCARNAATVEEHIREVMQMAQRLFAGRGE